MSLLKRLWNWLVRKTATTTTPQLVVVEEVEEQDPKQKVCELFCYILREHGVKPHWLNVERELFLDWYQGEPELSTVHSAMKEFCEVNETMKHVAGKKL